MGQNWVALNRIYELLKIDMPVQWSALRHLTGSWRKQERRVPGRTKRPQSVMKHGIWIGYVCVYIYLCVCVRIYQKIIYHMYIYIYEWDDIIQNYTKLSILENWATHSLNFTKHHLDSSSCMFVNWNLGASSALSTQTHGGSTRRLWASQILGFTERPRICDDLCIKCSLSNVPLPSCHQADQAAYRTGHGTAIT